MTPVPVIVWALDPFEPPGDLVASAARTAESIAGRLQAIIQPVYVLTPSQINLSTEFSEISESPFTEYYRPAAEGAMREMLKQFPISRIQSPKVLTVDSTSTHMAIDGLSHYADQIGAEAIIVSSHGRSGLGRFLLGSFAETLMLYSRRPVVVVHPGSKMGQNGDFRPLLVPSDLTDNSKAAWEEALVVAKKLNLEVMLFHCVPYPVEPVIQSGVYLLGGGWMPIHAYMSEEVQRRQERLEQWVDAGKERGLRVEGSIYSEGGGISDAIVRIAKERRVSMIAMAVQSGPITSAIVGSVTREVVRRAPSPVWILRYAAQKRGKKKAQAAA